MNWQTIFNPFSKFSEKQLLLVGLLLTVFGTYTGWLANASYDGVLDIHLISSNKLKNVFLENGINILTISIIFIILGKILNNKTRIIDILNTSLIYRFPLYLISLFSVFLLPKNFNEKVIKNSSTPEKIFESNIEIILSGLYAFMVILFAIYCIVLLVYGFKTATNIKKWQHFVVFSIFILIAEGVSKYLISLL